MSALPIRLANVSKRFDKTLALDDVSLEVRPGEVFGLVGPNGAGKTTIIRTVLDIIKPDSGTVEVFGRTFAPADRDRIGYLPEERGLYTRQPVGMVLEYLGALKGLSAGDARAAAQRWLDRFELGDALTKRVDQLSKGNQQKVQIAAALLAAPPIVDPRRAALRSRPGQRPRRQRRHPRDRRGRPVGGPVNPSDEPDRIALHARVHDCARPARALRRRARHPSPALEPRRPRAVRSGLSRLPARQRGRRRDVGR